MSPTPSDARRVVGPAAALVLLLAALAFAGFFPTYFGRFPRFAGTSWAIHFHVVTLLLWLAFALAQALLVRSGRVDLHRRAGKLAYALIPIMFVGFYLAIVDGQRRNGNPVLIVATLFDSGLFLAFAALGLWHRHSPEHHRRYMILALLPFLNPALGRLISPKVSIPLQLVIIVTLLVRARRQKTLARPYAVGLALFLGGLGAVMAVLLVWPDVPDRLARALIAS
jgi:hypothetical protein